MGDGTVASRMRRVMIRHVFGLLGAIDLLVYSTVDQIRGGRGFRGLDRHPETGLIKITTIRSDP